MVLTVTTATFLLTSSLHTHINTCAHKNIHTQLIAHTYTETHIHPNTKHKLTEMHTQTHTRKHRHMDSGITMYTNHLHLHENIEFWFGVKKMTKTTCFFQKWLWLEPLLVIGIKTQSCLVISGSFFKILWNKGTKGGHQWSLPGSMFPGCGASGLLAEVSQGTGCRII